FRSTAGEYFRPYKTLLQRRLKMKWHEVAIHTVEENEEKLSIFLNTISKGVSVEHSIDILKQKVDNFDEKFRLDPKDYPESNIRLVVYFDETQDIDGRIKDIKEYLTQTDLVNKEEIEIDRKIIEESDWENEWKKYFHSFRVSDT